jgi:hypothetical protein
MTTFGNGVLRVVGALQASTSQLEVYVETTAGAFQPYTRVGINWVPGPLLP